MSIRAALVVLVGVILPSRAAGFGWVQPPGRCYAKVWDRSWVGAYAYTSAGLRDMERVPLYQDHLLNLYGECGLSRRVTAHVALSPAGYARTAGAGTFYVGPLSAGLRVGLLTSGSVRLAVSGRYGYAPAVGDTPLWDSTITVDGEDRRVIYQPAVENHLGEVSLGLGRGFSWGRRPAYFGASLGVRLNSAETMDPVLTGEAQLGIAFAAVDLDLHLHLHEPSFQSVERTNVAGAGQTRFLGFGVTVSYRLSPALALFFNLEGVFYAVSNAATPSLAAGVQSRFGVGGG
jgi:hypothetical protein